MSAPAQKEFLHEPLLKGFRQTVSPYQSTFRLPILRGTSLIQCELQRLLLHVLRHLDGSGARFTMF